MKRWSVAVLVVAFTLAASPLAAAGTGNGGPTAKGKSKYNLVGKVVAVDAAAGSLTVRAKAGTNTVKAFRAADLVLAVDLATHVRRVTADGRVAGALGAGRRLRKSVAGRPLLASSPFAPSRARGLPTLPPFG